MTTTPDTTATFRPTEPHPVLQLPTYAEMQVMGLERWTQAIQLREKAIRREIQSPLWECYEPPIWRVCDALLGVPWLPDPEAAAIRQNLGFAQPVNVLYLLGAQRSSKTEYAVNRLNRLTQGTPDGLTWMFHNTMPASIDAHQKLFWKYLPANLRGRPILSQTTYIAYKDKTGFSDGSFVLPNLHKVRFLSYEMPLEDLQGLNVNAVAADEFVTPDHVETFKARVAVKNGFVIIMLAPINGYTPLVQSACDGAEVVRKSIAYLNPDDEGPRDIPRYLGLTETETDAMREWLDRRQKKPFPNVPWCRPEDCSSWLRGESGQPPPPPGRRFKTVPRIQRPADPEGRSAIVHFHGNDNPFGNPLSLLRLNAGVSEEIGNRIFYGLAKEGMARMFRLFDQNVHCIDPKAIPTHGTNYLIIDPAGRNFFMTWLRVTTRNAYVYREWPGNYEIPGQGIPGPWALPDGKLCDGRRGPAQEPFGFGLIDYKREIARLEGWTDADKPPPGNISDEDWVKNWTPENGAREPIQQRFLDSRFASTPHIERDRPVTMLENFADIGLYFTPTPGDDINEGVQGINDRLRYDTTRPIDALNSPRLYISKNCSNTIFALRTWRNSERGRGATKDPIDNLRYFVLSDCEHITPDMYASSGGGHY